MANPRAGCAYHRGEGLLTDRGDHSLGYAFLAEMSQQQQNSGQPLFAGIEKLVNQILFVPDVPGQQISDEHIGQSVFSMESLHHRFLLNAQKLAIGYCRCSSHAERLTCEATFAKKVPLAQDANGCFLSIVGHDRYLHLAALDIKQCVSRIPLREDGLLLCERHNLPSLADGGKERVRVELAFFLDAHKGNWRLSTAS